MDRTLQNYFNWNTWLMLGRGSVGVVVILILCLKEHFAKGPEPPASASEEQNAATGGVLLWQFVLRVQAMLALPEPAHAGGDLAAGVAEAMADGNAHAALGSTGAGAVLWLLIGAVLLTQGLRGRKREQQKEQVQDVR